MADAFRIFPEEKVDLGVRRIVASAHNHSAARGIVGVTNVAVRLGARDDHGRDSSVPRPTSTTSPPTLTFSTLRPAPSARTRSVLGRPQNRP
jgi:hypothetical protein